jgi:hypothetical protein
MSQTDQLIETLIKSNIDINNNVSSLTSEVSGLTKLFGEFVVIEAGRVEREKTQEAINKENNEFRKLNSEPLTRLRRWQVRVDKSSDKVFFLIGIALLGLLGFNFLG